DSKLDNQGVGGLDLPDRGTNFFEHENEFRAVETATPSANFQNQARFTYKQDRQSTTSVSNDPAVIVLGAFNSGGAQTDRHLTETMADAQDVAMVSVKRSEEHTSELQSRGHLVCRLLLEKKKKKKKL